MSNTLKIVIESVVVYILMYIVNYWFSKPGKKNDTQLELYYLSGIYGINIKKINKKKFRIISSLVNALIITTDYLIVVYLIKSTILRILIGIVLLILLIIICYGILGRYYSWKENKNV